MRVPPFAALIFLHFRFNPGWVYLGPLNHFENNLGTALQIPKIWVFYLLLSNSYRGLTEKHHLLF